MADQSRQAPLSTAQHGMQESRHPHSSAVYLPGLDGGPWPVPNSVSDRPVWQLTSSESASMHSYFDLCPWSADQRRLLVGRYDQLRTRTELHVLDAELRTSHQLGMIPWVEPHSGLMQQWVPGRQSVGFLTRSQGRDSGSSKGGTQVVDVDTGERRTYDGSLRMFHPSGRSFVSHTHEQTGTYGETAEQTGAFITDLDSGSVSRLVSVRDIVAVHPDRDVLEETGALIKHTKWSPDGSQLFLVVMNGEPRGTEKYVKSVVVMDVDSAGAALLGPPRLIYHGGLRRWDHPMWHPDGKHVFLNRVVHDDGVFWFTCVDVTTGQSEYVSERVPGGGHPSFDPAGERIVWEKVSQDGSGTRFFTLFLLHVETERTETLVRLPVTDHSHQGTHEHPVWSPDGRYILFNSDRTGHSELYAVDVSE